MPEIEIITRHDTGETDSIAIFHLSDYEASIVEVTCQDKPSLAMQLVSVIRFWIENNVADAEDPE